MLIPFFAIFLAASCLLREEAFAHHPVSETAPDHVVARSLIGLETQTAGFDLRGTRGNFLTVAGKSSLLITDQLALGLRVPFHVLWLSGQEVARGLGDLDLNLKYQLVASNEMRLSIGIGSELPTGAHTIGMGSGHIEAAPFVSGQVPMDSWTFHGTLSSLFSLAGAHHHEHDAPDAHGPTVNWVSPHAGQELQYHVGVIRSLGNHAHANLTLGGSTVLGHDPAFHGTSVYVNPALGVASGNWKYNFGPQIPLGANRRFDWNAGIMIDYSRM